MRQFDPKTMELWDKYARESHQIGPDYDYSQQTQGTKDSRGHLGDIGKMPWHPTFSDQSVYSALAPHGTWKDNMYIMSSKAATDDRLGQLQWMLDHGYNDGDKYAYLDRNGTIVKMKPRR